MNTDEIREWATYLIKEHNAEYEFCLVYEDDDLAEESEEDQRAIHDAMRAARVTVTWDE